MTGAAAAAAATRARHAPPRDLGQRSGRDGDTSQGKRGTMRAAALHARSHTD